MRPLFLALALLAASAGCSAPEPPAPFRQDEPENLLCVVIDLSGSYADKMTQDGRAYRFLTALCDRFFTDLAGGHNRVVVSQISGRSEAVLWDGRPERLRQQFPDPAAFRAYLLARADPSRSLVYHSLNETLEHVLLSYPGIEAQSGSEGIRTRSALVALTDMEDNGPDATENLRRLLGNLRRYAKAGGSVGIYFAGRAEPPQWQRHLRECGFPPGRSTVVSDIIQDSPVPTFE